MEEEVGGWETSFCRVFLAIFDKRFWFVASLEAITFKGNSVTCCNQEAGVAHFLFPTGCAAAASDWP